MLKANVDVVASILNEDCCNVLLRRHTLSLKRLNEIKNAYRAAIDIICFYDVAK